MAKPTLVSHHLCPYVQRVAIALDEKAIAFDRVYVDLSAKPEWFLEDSPLGKTPLLRVDGNILFESAVICEYLEDTLPHRLHPEDPLERARHRGWMEFGSALLHDIWGLETAQDAAGVERKSNDIRRKLEYLEPHLGEGPFFAGARFHLVDAVFGPVFRYFDVFDELADLGVFAAVPKVRAWRAALAQRPSVRNAVTTDYAARLRTFLHQKNAYLLELERARKAAASSSAPATS
ncbi:MAG TPA: glutathione S-transferase family protein [Kofleriaceae bacterium]|nr:glutathione S-transferase family protein [Kofleriaceae bacterium]